MNCGLQEGNWWVVLARYSKILMSFTDNEAPESDAQTSMRLAIREPDECAATC
jgi:hypothetical protein